MKTTAAKLPFLTVLLAFLSLGTAPSVKAWDEATATEDSHCLRRAHSHNDYAQKRPLSEALDWKFGSIEADIFLRDGKLLVGHSSQDLRPEKTLEAMYLAPLQERVARNKGWVYEKGTSVLLLIDIKTEADATYKVLREALAAHEGMLTRFTSDSVRTNAITVVLTGERPRAILAAEPVRLASHDGRLEDLASMAPPNFIGLVSDDWKGVFRWNGKGEMPTDELKKLRGLVSRTHLQGRKLRLWGAPDNEPTWSLLYAEGVDLINTDHLEALARFMRRAEARK